MKIARRLGMVLVVLVVVRVIAGCFVPRLNINDVTTGATPEYPELQPQMFAQSTGQVFDAAAAVARAQGWEVTEERAAGVIEAVATTRLMHFKDDITITLSHEGTQTKVVIRSHSRVGKGDLGTNARRIKLFQEELARKVGSG